MAEGERPHVAGDDILLLFGDVEHLLGVHAGIAGCEKPCISNRRRRPWKVLRLCQS